MRCLHCLRVAVAVGQVRRVAVAQELERCGCDSWTGNMCVWLKDCRYVCVAQGLDMCVWLKDCRSLWVWLKDCKYVGVAQGL